MAAARVNARIPEEQALQLEELCQATGGSASEVIRGAITHYHALILGARGRAREALAATGFIGCGEADPALSSTYKEQLDFGAKHGGG